MLLLSAVVFLTIAGCESVQDIDRAAGEWAKERKAQRAAAEKARRQRGVLSGTRRSCRRIMQSLDLPNANPDTVYVRLKRFFGFNSPSEAEKSYSFPDWLPYTNYRHETLPGVRYSMSEDITWPSSVYGQKRVWLTLEIERTDRGTDIRWSWCQGVDGWEKLGDPAKVQRHLAKDIGRVARGG
ncbi:MAG TPA: hypothetical protein EYP40_07080 [Chromatiales bacterium]|nr:hypothetical protein [Chromatiales bacterium]